MRKNSLIILTLMAFAQCVHETRFEENNLEKITQEYLNINTFQFRINSIVIGICNQMFNTKNSVSERLGQMSPQDAKHYFRHSQFAFTTQTELLLSLKDSVNDYSNSILKGKFTQFYEVMKTSIENYIHYTIAVNPKSHDRRSLVELFETLMNELPKQLYGAEFKGWESGEFKSILKNTQDLQSDSQKESLISKLKEHDMNMALSETMIRLVLSVSSYSDFSPAISDPYLEKIKSVFLRVQDYLKDCREEYFQEQILPFIQSIHGLKYITEWSDRHLFMNRVTLHIIQKFDDNQISRIIHSLLSQRFEETSKAIRSHKYFDVFQAYVKTKYETGRTTEDNNEDTFLFYDYMVCFPGKIIQRKFSERQIEDIIKKSSNINNYAFFLNFFKYYSSKHTQVFDILYEVLTYLRNVNKDYKIDEQTWSDHMSKSFYSSYANAYVFDKDRNSEKVPNPKAEFINTVYILSKMVIDNKIHYYYEMFNRHDPVYRNGFRDYKWHDIFSHNDNYVIDYKRMKNGAKPVENLPRLKYGTITNLVIPTSGSLSDQDAKLLRHPKFMWEVQRRLEEGQRVMSITDIDPAYELEEGEEVLVVVIDRVPKICRKAQLRQLFNI